MKKQIAGLILAAVFISGIVGCLGERQDVADSIGFTGMFRASHVPTGPLVLTDNVSVAAVADSGSGTRADPYIIENRIFNLNYTDSGIITLGTTCYILIRDCIFNATDPSGVGVAFIAQSNGESWVDNCTFMDCGFTGAGWLLSNGGRITNSVLINNSGILLDTANDFLAENITMEDSFIVAVNLGILTHGISHNVTIKNVVNYETGAALTSGLDFLITDVDDFHVENFTLDCEVDTCQSIIWNATGVTMDGFMREAPEMGLFCINVSNMAITGSEFDIDDNSTIQLLNCSDVIMTGSNFTNSGSNTTNLGVLGTYNVTMNNCIVQGGNLTLIQVENLTLSDTRLTLSEAFLENVTRFDLLETNLTIARDFIMVNCSHWDVGSCDIGFEGTMLNFSGYIDNITVHDSLVRVNSSTGLTGTLIDITNINFTHNAYSPYFDMFPDLSKSDFNEGDSLPYNIEFFGIFNDSAPFYSVELFGYWPLKPVTHFRVIAPHPNALVVDKTYSIVFDGTLGDPSNSYQWNFGDGTANLTTLDVNHKFSRKGTYAITLTVTDGNGDVSVYSAVVYVNVSGDLEPFSTLPPLGGAEGQIGFFLIGIVSLIAGVAILIRSNKKLSKAINKGLKKGWKSIKRMFK